MIGWSCRVAMPEPALPHVVATKAGAWSFSSKGDRARSDTRLGWRREGIGGWEPTRRRTILLLLGAGASSLAAGKSLGQGESPTTLLNAPLEVQGEWGKSARGAATAVISRMREVCLAGVKLLSDQQPSGLRVQNHTSGSPAIWLHNDASRIAWIIVNIGERDWSKLAYQFGHELGHVLANSWGPTVNHSLRANGWRKPSLRRSLCADWGSLQTVGNSGRSLRMTHRSRTPFGNTSAARSRNTRRLLPTRCGIPEWTLGFGNIDPRSRKTEA
jgi:hypothetical protein